METGKGEKMNVLIVKMLDEGEEREKKIQKKTYIFQKMPQ